MPTKKYVLKYDYISDYLEKREPYHEGHVDLVKKMVDEGTCLSAGIIGSSPTITGAFLVFVDEESVNKYTQRDPYMTGGIVTKHSVEEWNVLLEKKPRFPCGYW